MTIENNRGRDDEVPKRAGLPASRAASLRCQIVAAPMTSRHETPTRSPSGNFRTILVGLIVTLTLSALDQTIVGPALPQIASEFGGLGHLAWIVMAFMLASTVTMPLYGKASDLYGRRPLFVVSIVVFLIGSALCGLAHSMIQLILFRGLQGLGAGGLMTLAQITIADIMPPRERGRYQGLFAAVFAVCSIAGPLLGGVITDVLSWRWLFYVNLPIGGAALALILLALPRSGKRVAHHLDYVGALLLAAGTVCLLVLMTWGGTVYPWRSAVIAGLGGSAAVLLLLFVQCERVASEPLLPMPLFRNRVFVIAVLVTALTAMALFGAFVFLPTYFQLVLGLSPSTAGLLT
ncbi:MAG TPA: MFS transporter, partial [Steroidobacteraceae bacterium]